MQRRITVPSSMLGAAKRVGMPWTLGVMRQGVVAPRLDRQPRIKTMSVSLAAMPGIARPLEGVDAMRLQLARLPDALHRARRNPCRLGQPSAGLAGRLVRGGCVHVG